METGVRGDAAPLAGFDERVAGGGALTASIRSCEQPFLASQGDPTNGSLARKSPISGVPSPRYRRRADHRFRGIAHHIGHLGLGREHGEENFDPCVQCLGMRRGVILRDTPPLIRRLLT